MVFIPDNTVLTYISSIACSKMNEALEVLIIAVHTSNASLPERGCLDDNNLPGL